MRKECAVCVFFGDGIHVGGISSFYGISFYPILGCDSPAIVNAFE